MKILHSLCMFLFLNSLGIPVICMANSEKRPQEGNEVKPLSSSESSVVLELEVTNFEKHAIMIEGKKYYVISAPNAHSMLQKGMPDVPEFSRCVVIPPTAACHIRVLNVEYEDVTIPVAPSKGNLSRDIDPLTVPYTFYDIYKKDAFYPSDIVSVDTPFLLRDVRGCVVRMIPFQYNPVTHILRVYKKIQVKILFSGTDGRNVPNSMKHTYGRAFRQILMNQFINHERIDSTFANNIRTFRPERDASQVEYLNEKMLVICCDSFATDMRNFLIHKNNLGLPTTMVKMSQVGTTADHVAEYIQNAYDTDSTLTYVLLVGDASMVPTKRCYFQFEEGGSDPSYSLVSGDDYYPDLFIGRFSAKNRNDVHTLVERTIRYENDSNKSWHHCGVGIASDEFDSSDSIPDYQILRSIRDKLLSYHYTEVAEFYDGSQGGEDDDGDPTSLDICSKIDKGVSIINYSGHGSIYNWHTGNFRNSTIKTLKNDNKLPIIFSSACRVGCFTGSIYPCFAENWLVARNSINGEPTGAIGFYGSSTRQAWFPPRIALNAFINMLVNEDYHTLGALCFGASSIMLDSHKNFAKETFLAWNIFGDPSLSVIPNNNIGQTIFISDILTTDSIYEKKYVDIHNATILDGTEIIVHHEKSTRISGTFKTENGSKLIIN